MELRASARKDVLSGARWAGVLAYIVTARGPPCAVLSAAEKKPHPPLSDMFTDVYSSPPASLVEQREAMLAMVEAHPAAYAKAH